MTWKNPYKLSIRSCLFFFPAISDDVFFGDFTCIIGIGVFSFLFYHFPWNFHGMASF